jgi:hypothetical protein
MYAADEAAIKSTVFSKDLAENAGAAVANSAGRL